MGCHALLQGVFQPKVQIHVSCIVGGRYFTVELPGSPQCLWLTSKMYNGGASLAVQWLRVHLQCRGHWLIPGLGRFHMLWSSWVHAPQLLSPHSRAREPHLLKPTGQSLCSTTREARAPQLEGSPCSPQPDRAHMQQQRAGTAKTCKTLF